MAKILLIEDDPLILRMYQKAFEYDGYEVVTASDGEQGLARAKEVEPTLILLDVMMPKMNGLEVLEKLKTEPMLRSVPVVVLTNLSDTSDAEAMIERGAVKYIVKSNHRPAEIVRMVKEILSGYTRDELPGSY